MQATSTESEEGRGGAVDGERERDKRVETAHGLYREGKHEEALRLYSEALQMALEKEEEEKEKEKGKGKEKEEAAASSGQRRRTKKKIVMALHSNRAACLLKMQRFREAAAECTAVLELEPEHPGALMLRAQTFVTLRDYQAALFDVGRLLRVDPHSPLYCDLHARLRTQLALAPIPEAPEEGEEEEEEEAEEEAAHQEQPKEKEKEAVPVPVPGGISAWQAIPKPKGHSGLDYSRWDQVQGDGDSDSDSDDDDDEAAQPQYRFRVRTVSMRPVK